MIRDHRASVRHLLFRLSTKAGTTSDPVFGRRALHSHVPVDHALANIAVSQTRMLAGAVDNGLFLYGQSFV